MLLAFVVSQKCHVEVLWQLVPVWHDPNPWWQAFWDTGKAVIWACPV